MNLHTVYIHCFTGVLLQYVHKNCNYERRLQNVCVVSGDYSTYIQTLHTGARVRLLWKVQ